MFVFMLVRRNERKNHAEETRFLIFPVVELIENQAFRSLSGQFSKLPKAIINGSPNFVLFVPNSVRHVDLQDRRVRNACNPNKGK